MTTDTLLQLITDVPQRIVSALKPNLRNRPNVFYRLSLARPGYIETYINVRSI